MIDLKHATIGGSAILFAFFAGSIAEASNAPERLRCLLSRDHSNPHQVLTICDTRTARGIARLQAAQCDPATLSDSAMRKRCAEMMATGA